MCGEIVQIHRGRREGEITAAAEGFFEEQLAGHDAAMLEAAHHAFAINPNADLELLARRRGLLNP